MKKKKYLKTRRFSLEIVQQQWLFFIDWVNVNETSIYDCKNMYLQ